MKNVKEGSDYSQMDQSVFDEVCNTLVSDMYYNSFALFKGTPEFKDFNA